MLFIDDQRPNKKENLEVSQIDQKSKYFEPNFESDQTFSCGNIEIEDITKDKEFIKKFNKEYMDCLYDLGIYSGDIYLADVMHKLHRITIRNA